MKSYNQLHDETIALHYDFLILDTKTAHTFLDVAQTTRNEETRSRNLQNAATAYAAVLRLSSRVAMTEQQSTEVEDGLKLLKQRIDSLSLSEPPTGEIVADQP